MYLFRPKTRQRLDPSKIDYFINWIIDSNLLINVPWGHSNLKLNSGVVIPIPRQVLQAQHSQIVYLYKQHCDDVGISPMSNRTVYSILNSRNVTEQSLFQALMNSLKLLLIVGPA